MDKFIEKLGTAVFLLFLLAIPAGLISALFWWHGIPFWQSDVAWHTNTINHPLLHIYVLMVVVGYAWRVIWHFLNDDQIYKMRDLQDKLKKSNNDRANDAHKAKQEVGAAEQAHKAEVDKVHNDYDQILRVVLEKLTDISFDDTSTLELLEGARPVDKAQRTLTQAEVDAQINKANADADAKVMKAHSGKKFYEKRAKECCEAAGAERRARESVLVDAEAFANRMEAYKKAWELGNWSPEKFMLAAEDLVEAIAKSKGGSKDSLPALLKRIRYELGEFILLNSELTDEWVVRLTRDHGGPLADLIDERLVREERVLETWPTDKKWHQKKWGHYNWEKKFKELAGKPMKTKAAWWLKEDEDAGETDEEVVNAPSEAQPSL